MRCSLHPAHPLLQRRLGPYPARGHFCRLVGNTRAREGIMHQSFPSVCGQPNLRLPTFVSASAIDASVFSHRLQRRASSNAGSSNAGSNNFVGMPRPSTLLVAPSGDSPSYSFNDVPAGSFVAATLPRPPFNTPFGHSSFVAAILRRAPSRIPFGHSSFVTATPHHVSSNVAVGPIFSDNDCTHTSTGKSGATPMPVHTSAMPWTHLNWRHR